MRPVELWSRKELAEYLGRSKRYVRELARATGSYGNRVDPDAALRLLRAGYRPLARHPR